ncbi:hypothetical protein F4604DRAFT_1678034 [Suillus subluteus]|nr:hypothetical protein F4604DRAFT_1678034 [Suillus subluteus]
MFVKARWCREKVAAVLADGMKKKPKLSMVLVHPWRQLSRINLKNIRFDALLQNNKCLSLEFTPPSDNEALNKESKKTLKYATLALCNWQVLEEINDFNSFGPESKDNNNSIEDIDDEQSMFTFSSVTLNSKPKGKASLCFLNQDPSLVPKLIVDPVLRLPVGHGMPAPSSGGPADPPQGTQYNSISDISSQEIVATLDQFSSPSPFPCGSDQNLLNLKHPVPALATTETLQVVQKVKIGEGGS